MIKEVKNFFRGIYPAINKSSNNKNRNICYKETQRVQTINAIIDAVVNGWYENPLSLLSIAPVSQALNQYINIIDGIDLLIKKRIANKPDEIFFDKNAEYSTYQGGYYFNNKIINIKDIFKKIILVNELYYKYYILYNKEGFIDIVLNNITKSECGMYITIAYKNSSYKFIYDIESGNYKANIKGIYINSITNEFEFTLHEYIGTNLDHSFINQYKTPIYPVLPHIATYIKALHTNLYCMTEVQSLKGLLTFDSSSHPDSIKVSMDQVSSVLSNGGVLSLDAGAKYQDMTRNNDMDYKDTIVHAENSIYSLLGIPIVLIRTENSTYDNYKTAYNVFIESILNSKMKKAVSLLNDIIFKEIHEEFNLYLALDWSDLFVVKERRVDNAINLKNNGIISLNEAREEIGRVNSDGKVVEIDGGNDIYIQNNLVKMADAGALKGEWNWDNGEQA